MLRHSFHLNPFSKYIGFFPDTPFIAIASGYFVKLRALKVHFKRYLALNSGGIFSLGSELAAFGYIFI